MAAIAALPDLGAAATFDLLAASNITNTGPSIITGNVGVSPGTAVVGFPPGVVLGGAIHIADGPAASAQGGLTGAYNSLAGQHCDTVLSGVDLGGRTLMPGVYCFSTSAQLTGTLALDGMGDPNAVFVFQIGSTLTTASNAAVNMIGNAIAGRVFWQVGSSATLGTGTRFSGNILAQVSVTATVGSTIAGRAMARTGAVTVDTLQSQAVPIVPIVGSDAGCSLDAGDAGDAETGCPMEAGVDGAIVSEAATDAAAPDVTDTPTLAETGAIDGATTDAEALGRISGGGAIGCSAGRTASGSSALGPIFLLLAGVAVRRRRCRSEPLEPLQR